MAVRETYRAILIGDSTVGKTNFLMRTIYRTFVTDYVATGFIDYYVDMNIDGMKIRLTLDNSAGQDDYDEIRYLGYTNQDVVAVCYDVTNTQTLERCISKWKPELERHIPSTPIVLLGMKTDLQSSVPMEDALLVGMQIEAKDCLQCSSKDGTNITAVHESLIRHAQQYRTWRKKISEKRNCLLQ